MLGPLNAEAVADPARDPVADPASDPVADLCEVTTNIVKWCQNVSFKIEI